MSVEHPASALSGYGSAQGVRDANNGLPQLRRRHDKSRKIANVNILHPGDPASVPFLETFCGNQLEEPVHDGPDMLRSFRSPGKLDLIVRAAAGIFERCARVPVEARRGLGRPPSRTAAPDCRRGPSKHDWGFRLR